MRFLRSLKEVFLSSLPLVAVMVAVCVFMRRMSDQELLKLFIGYVLVVVGQTFFLVGLDSSIMPIGKLVGGSLSKLKKVVYIVLFGFLFGLLATVAEPALAVLGIQVHAINGEIDKTLFVWVLSAGVGAAVALAMFRVIKNINIKVVFAVFYVIVFAVVFVVPDQFVSLAFDGSGATTGDVSVPFILALGLGVSTTMSKAKTNDESFGIIGIASIGPILAVFLYGIILGNAPGQSLQKYDAGGASEFLDIAFGNFGDVALAIVPVIVIFVIFQLFFIKLTKKQLGKILICALVVYIGLHIFLTGVDYGFALAGMHIGKTFMDASAPWLRWLLLPVGFLLGFAITLSEPAVTVLGEQVEGITNGYIKKMTMRMTLAFGIGLAALLSLLKILTDINILWFLVPLYAAALILMIFTPKLFVGLAFDSGGVTGGAITSAFLTPLTLGVSAELFQGPFSGFGMIAFISVTPLIAVQTLGIIYSLKLKKLKESAETETEVFGESAAPAVGTNAVGEPAITLSEGGAEGVTLENADIKTDETGEESLAEELDKLSGLY
ncbi:MAG: DUF1538 domain-containing protein [Clostridiales bacterium]|jgi:hypothetical protein|nr:DUF1538 domain-containing protein [Clostridiales bacterium]